MPQRRLLRWVVVRAAMTAKAAKIKPLYPEKSVRHVIVRPVSASSEVQRAKSPRWQKAMDLEKTKTKGRTSHDQVPLLERRSPRSSVTTTMMTFRLVPALMCTTRNSILWLHTLEITRSTTTVTQVLHRMRHMQP